MLHNKKAEDQMTFKFLISIILFASSVAAIAASSAITNQPPVTGTFCHDFGQYGYPTGVKSNFFLCREGYAVAYNCQTKQPNYVVYRLTGQSVSVQRKRHDKFKADMALPTRCRATLKDYRRSGYDRGHMAPYGSMDFSSLSARQSFLLSNMSPQKKGLNRQGWERLESNIRKWTKLKGELYVYTGPIFKKGSNKTIGRHRVAVPNYFFKIIYAPKQNQAIAFVMPNARVKKSQIAQYRVSIDNINQRTGMNFLANINVPKNIVSPMWKARLFSKRKRHRHK